MLLGRHFERINSSVTDILILDRNGLEFLKNCIPLGMRYCSIDTRSSIPYLIKTKFFLRLFINIFKYGFKPISLLCSIIEILKPKSIVTFTDNSSMIGQISLIFPSLLVLSVQNGVRTLPDDFVSHKSKFYIPIYFSFGKYEKNLITYLNVPYIEIYEVGSLKLGLFLSKDYQNGNNGICFISQYRDSFLNSEDKISRDCLLRMEGIYRNLVVYSDSNIINVAMHFGEESLYYEKEKEFYLNLSRTTNLIGNEASSFSSYKIAFSSSIIVAMDSTLAFEMFGCGKRVLFCDFAKDKLYTNRKGVDFLFDNLPKEVILETFDKAEMDSKINTLLSMSDAEYLTLTKKSRNYFIKQSKEFPHEIISTYIENNINKELGKYV